MHLVARCIVHLDRQEGPCPDMQRYPVNSDAACAQRRFQLWGKMQSRRGGRDRALMGGEHGLVVGGIAIISSSLRGDVGRQRRAAEIRYRLVERRPME